MSPSRITVNIRMSQELEAAMRKFADISDRNISSAYRHVLLAGFKLLGLDPKTGTPLDPRPKRKPK